MFLFVFLIFTMPNVSMFLSCLEEVRNNKASRSCKAEILLHFTTFVRYSFALCIVMQINSETKNQNGGENKILKGYRKGKTLCGASKFFSGIVSHLEQFPLQELVLFSSPHANRTKPALQTKQFIC